MVKNSVFLVVCLGLMCALASVGSAAVPGLVGWWSFDEGSGNVAADASGNGNDGTFNGIPQWVEGQYGSALEFDGSGAYLDCGSDPSLDLTTWTIAFWLNINVNKNFNGFVIKGLDADENFEVLTYGDGHFHFPIQFTDGRRFGNTANGVLIVGEWAHYTYTYDAAEGRRFYKDGFLIFEDTESGTPQTSTDPLLIGNEGGQSRFVNGVMDDVAIFDYAMSVEEVQDIMQGLAPAELAGSPDPEDAAVDVSRDAGLVWAPGEVAVTHDVYFGTTFGDVNDATATNPLGALASQGQDASTFDPGRLDFSQTYFWRVDEANGAPDFTVFGGAVWSFTVEPFSVPISNVTATASSSFGASGPERTIDGSGLVDDLHGVSASDMWISGGVPATIEYAFDRAYKLHELWIWNSNQLIEAFVGFGAKDVVIEHSLDGENWTVLDGVGPLAQATGASGYAHNTTIDFGGATAQHVRVTVNSVQGIAPQASLSEVRFFSIPTLATRPSPASGATDVLPDVPLAWGRDGREAGSHDVYLGTDPDNLSLAGTVSESSFDTLAVDLQLSQTYYWRVDEVNDAMEPSTWMGDVWSFTTVDAIGIDDMESYADAEFLEIWATWVDGFDDPANGSLVGNGAAGTPETDIVHGDSQSLPMDYGNGGAAQSEATRTFAVSQNWTRAGVTHLVVWFHGAAGNTGQMYLKINGTKIPFDGPAGNIALAAWQAWSIDLASLGMNLQSVRSLTVGVEGNGATGILYVDDIALVQSAPEAINEWRVSAGTDDAEEKILDGGTMDLGSSDLELGYEGNMAPAALQTIGVRWVGVGVPRGATITEAWVQFSADDVDNPYHALPVSLVIEGQLSPNPETFAATLGVISSRATTSAEVVWDIPVWLTVHAMGPEERTPDISSIIQEIVNQPDWSGESLVLMFADNPANPSEGAREAESFDGSASDAPLLHISFE